MKSPVSEPKPQLPPHEIAEENGHKSIDVHDWKITAASGTIVTAAESDQLQKTLGFPLPEMTFGNNFLELLHKPSGWKYRFDAEGALKLVRNGEFEDGDGGVKVGYADAWLKSR